MKKIIALVLAVAMIASVAMLAGCGNSNSKQSGGGSTKEKLTMATNATFPPYEYKEGEEFVGIDVEIAKAIADKLGMELEIHKVEWSSIGISLDAGDYDCIIAGMGRTKEREMSYSFTTPYYYRDNCIVVKADGAYKDVTGLSQLAGTGCKVTTQLGTGWIPLLDQIDGAVTGSNYETTSECFMAVSNGVADICIVDLPTAQSALLTNKDLKIITFDENDSFSGDEEMVNVCIATRKSDTALRDKIQGAMDALGWSDKAKMDDLMAKVIGQQPAASSAPAEAELMIDIAIFGKEDYFIA